MSMKDDVKERVSIATYFYNIILPQMSYYYNDYDVNFDYSPIAKCCLHDEDTPSMRVYEDTNTFFCWGCRKGGDVINLHRLFTYKVTGTKPSFKESVNFLYEFFVKGNNTAKVIRSTAKKYEYKSKLSDVMRFSKYCIELENALLVDSQITWDKKLELYTTMDKATLLVKLNHINAKEGLEHVRNKVREVL